MITEIRPLFDRVMIRPVVAEEQRGGIFIPDNAKERPQEGQVIAVGEGKRTVEGLLPVTVKLGDSVLFGKFSGAELEINGEKVLVMREDEIIAVIKHNSLSRSA